MTENETTNAQAYAAFGYFGISRQRRVEHSAGDLCIQQVPVGHHVVHDDEACTDADRDTI